MAQVVEIGGFADPLAAVLVVFSFFKQEFWKIMYLPIIRLQLFSKDGQLRQDYTLHQ
jgi:hypothetical protein